MNNPSYKGLFTTYNTGSENKLRYRDKNPTGAQKYWPEVSPMAKYIQPILSRPFPLEEYLYPYLQHLVI